MAFERAEALYLNRAKFYANYEKYCSVIPVLSEGKGVDPADMKLKCEKVAYSTTLLAKLLNDRNKVCAAFSQVWWQTAKNMPDIRTLKLVVKDAVRGTVSIAPPSDSSSTSLGAASSSPIRRRRNAISLDSSLDTMKDIDVFQYTHNTEYYCDTPNDFMVLLQSMPAERACSFQAYSFFLQEVKQGCDLRGILQKMKSICTSYLSFFFSFFFP